MRSNDSVCIVHNSIRTIIWFRMPYIRILLAEGISVSCIAPNDDDQARQQLEAIGVEVFTIDSKGTTLNAVWLNYSILRLLVLKKLSVLFVVHFISTIVMVSPALLVASRVVCVIEGVGSYFTGREVQLIFMKWFLGLIASRVVFMNHDEKKLLGTSTDLVLGGVGVDTDHFSPSPVEYEHGTSRDSDTIRLLFVGRLLHDKGILDFFEVLRMLEKRSIQFRATIIGDFYTANPGAVSVEEIECYRQEFGSKVVFCGYSSNPVRHYRQSDVLLLLSKHEGFPVSIMEASACGVPSVGYDVIGVRDSIVNHVNGLLVPFGELDSAVDAVVSCVRKDMRISSRRYAVEHFDGKGKADILTRVFHDISNRDRSSSR